MKLRTVSSKGTLPALNQTVHRSEYTPCIMIEDIEHFVKAGLHAPLTTGWRPLGDSTESSSSRKILIFDSGLLLRPCKQPACHSITILVCIQSRKMQKAGPIEFRATHRVTNIWTNYPQNRQAMPDHPPHSERSRLLGLMVASSSDRLQ